MSFADGLDNEKEKIDVIIEGEEEKAKEAEDAIKDATKEAIESAKEEIAKDEAEKSEESKDDAETENLKEESKDDAETENLKEETEEASKDDAETENLKEETEEASKDDAETENLKEEDSENKESDEKDSKDSEKEESEDKDSKDSDKKEDKKESDKDSDKEKKEDKKEKKDKKAAIQKEEPEILQWMKYGADHVYPFLIAGGVLLFIAYLLDTIAGYGTISGEYLGGVTPVAAIIKYIAKRALWFVVPVLAAYIAKAMAGKDGMIVGFVGGILVLNGNAGLSSQLFTNNALPDGKELGVVGRFVAKQAFQQSGGGVTISGYLGAICAGLLAGFIVLELKELTDKLPEKLNCIKVITVSLVAIFLEGVFLCFVFNPLIGTLYSGLFKAVAAMRNDGMITIMALVLGMMINVDISGAFKQVAYLFGTGMASVSAGYISSGMAADDPSVVSGFIAMAAVMVGGMVAPTGIALASMFFPKKFTKEERAMAIPNLIMGAGCLTEGAIPAAVNDPLRVIPSTMVGGGIAALIVALAKCTVEAPIGGLLTMGTISSPVIFIVAWLVGSAVTCVMLGLLKKKKEEE